MVELAQTIITSTHQSQNLASMRIERYQRHLWIRNYFCRASLGQFLAALLHHLVNSLHSFVDGIGGHLLQVRIKRRINAQAFGVVSRVAELLSETLADQVDKVGRFARIHAHGGKDATARPSPLHPVPW